jgi:hypothetical protein
MFALRSLIKGCAGLWNRLSSSYDAYCCNITASRCMYLNQRSQAQNAAAQSDIGNLLWRRHHVCCRQSGQIADATGDMTVAKVQVRSTTTIRQPE